MQRGRRHKVRQQGAAGIAQNHLLLQLRYVPRRCQARVVLVLDEPVERLIMHAAADKECLLRLDDAEAHPREEGQVALQDTAAVRLVLVVEHELCA